MKPSSALRGALRPGVTGRDVFAWAMYDFANSGYTTVVITALFNAYFVASVAARAPWATLAWTLALSASYLLVIMTAPLLGAWADLHAAKKRLLFWSTAGCVLFTALLSFARPETLLFTLLCLVLSNFCFGVGENVIAAFLPELAKPRGMGRVSGWGWGWGYVGGLIALALCLAYIGWAEEEGLAATHYVPVSMLIVAAFFLLASLPTLLWLPERATPQEGKQTAREAWREVKATLAAASRFPDLFRFLLAFLAYQAGVNTVIALAAVYASEAMGMTTRQILVLIIVVNVAAALAALGFGHLQDRLGPLRMLAATLIGWLVALCLAWLAQGPALFWTAALLIGVCLGAAQTGGRAVVGLLSPAGKRGEFFGFWGLMAKLSAVLGPPVYGATVWAAGGDHRQALLHTGLFFLVGLWLLAGVRLSRGHRAALRADRLGR
ncbi:MAG: MFS transporter [Rhodocyclaceae bacterium]|nr:MFS transporter [Rhodocyclaceae bacterium]